MKRIFSAIMVVAILFCVFPVQVFSFDAEDVSNLPVVIVPGYGTSQMYYTAQDGSVEHVWGVVMEDLIYELLSKIADVGRGLGSLAFGNPEPIARVLGEGFVNLYGKLACSSDGSSMYDISLYYTTPEETNSAYLMEKHPDGSFRHEIDIMEDVALYVGNENIFNFNCDFRMGAVSCATALDEYIEAVLAYTGAEKVNIVAISHGGQVTATYLTLFGDKKQVNNAVLNVPAIGGAGLALDILKGDFDFDEITLVEFLEYGFISETDYVWLVQAEQLGFLDEVLNEFLPYAKAVLGNWGSIWDFIEIEHYEEMKELCLDYDENAKLIEESDFFHYSIMPQFNTSLQKCNDEYDMLVSIIAGTDINIVTGLKENSDGIITTKASTGATVSEYGKRFSDGYIAINGDNRYVSPSMTIDASTAFLPDTTWFIEGLFHGMEYKDEFSASLLLKLLLTNEIKDVYSNSEFPRFHATTNAARAVFAKFNQSLEGYLSADDTSLVITNLSKKYPMKLISINCKGAWIGFDLGEIGELQPGESITIPFVGEVPKVGGTCCSVTITYKLNGSPTAINERKFSYTINNGDFPEYDINTPYVDISDLNTGHIPDDTHQIIQDLGLIKLFSMIFNMLEYSVKLFGITIFK
ncbi:MAG TPA: hypothetical protein VFC76_03940 [Oscillospiraceae bacterium]|nr:hypothetical protein [Oscillospiraceae bacterium]